MSLDNEIHELPLPNRIVEAEVLEWIDHATVMALSSRGELGTEPAERKAIEEMRHLHLADYSYTLVPRILDKLKRAGLLRNPNDDNAEEVR